jgi:hypothetical protein
MVRSSGFDGPGQGSSGKWICLDKRARSAPFIDKHGEIIYPDKLCGQALSRLAEMPDVRMDVTEKVRQLLENGHYEISGRKVAERIVINALAERAW